MQQALAVRPEPTVPCNNDLLAANFVDDGDRLWLIDYEYGGNNDPCFELGNIWSESLLTLEHLEVLVDSYYGEHLRHKVARARLLGLMARYGWTLWASIQAVGQPDRLRLLVLGDGEVRPRGGRAGRPGPRPAPARRGAPAGLRSPAGRRRRRRAGQVSKASTTAVVDRVLRPGEPVLRRDAPPDGRAGAARRA